MPTAAEAGLPGYEVATWYAMWAPRGTPTATLQRMEKELRTALESTPIKEAWRRNGSGIPSLYGAEFGKFVATEVERWGKVVRDAGVKLE
jgi:tripartite-type tricarboxylate transporter receptor subunit TctC